MIYLKERREDLKSVDGTGPIRVRHQLVDMTAPCVLSIVTDCGLEGCQDGGEEWRGWRRKTEILQIVDIVT